MIYRLTFKTPDVYDQLDSHELDRDAVIEAINEWVKYGEYVTIEFDTKKGTAIVVRV